MSTLRAYVGSRETAMKSPGRANQPRLQPAPSDERVQAKLHEMGFSNVQDQFNGEAQNEPQTKHQTAGDQHRLALTRTKLHRNLSVSSSTNNRWHGYKSTPGSPPSAKDEIESEKGVLRDQANHYDPFDTDTENLDSTITLSDLDDAQAFQAWSLPGKAATNRLGQIYESEYFRGESLSSGVVHRRGQYDNPLNAPENINLTRNEEEYATDNGLDEDAPDREEQIRDENSSQGLAEEFTGAEYVHYDSKEPSKVQAIDAGSFMASSTAYQKLVMRDSGERASDSASPFIKVPYLDPGHGRDNTPHPFLKHDSSRLEDFGPSSSAGIPKKLEPDVTKGKQVSISSHQHKTPSTGDSQSSMRQQSEPQRITTRTLTPSETPVPLIDRVYNLPNIPSGASRQQSHDADNATFENHGRKLGIDLDFSPTQLRDMTYERLRHESFDGIKPVQGSADQALPEKLQNVYDLKGSIDPQLKRRTFFSNLTIEQYEECGNLMVEKFSDMVTRYKVERQQKRMVARAFEEEIAHREERVRAKNVVVDQDLSRLRKAGEDVVRGKEV